MAETQRTQCLGGIFYVKVDGKQLKVSADAITVPLTTETRTTQVSTSGVAGYTSTPRSPFVECSAFKTTDLDSSIFGRDNLTVTVEFVNGEVYSLTDAWVANDVDLDGAQGKTTIRFEGLNGGFI